MKRGIPCGLRLKSPYTENDEREDPRRSLPRAAVISMEKRKKRLLYVPPRITLIISFLKD